MSNAIYKYELKPVHNQAVLMPVGAQILCVQPQGNRISMWAYVSIDETSKEERFFDVFLTGQEIPDEMVVGREYVGTIQQCDGAFVLHIFERS